MPDLDVLYLAYNRVEFTRVTFQLLLANTDWSLVRGLRVYDDGSTDGTYKYLADAVGMCPVPARLTRPGFGSPVTTMKHYLNKGNPAEAFVKVDNDIAVPPGWLNNMLDVFDQDPSLDLLGMEAGQTWLPGRNGRKFDGVYGWTSCSHIGGVGVMRTAAFHDRPRLRANGRYGFTEWQHEQEPVRGWITPDLLVPQLDRIPEEPWLSLSKSYREAGWQRTWPLMNRKWGRPYYDWIEEP